jgi:transposase
MKKERITLTMKEQRINDILVKLITSEITAIEATRLTGLSERQIYRKKKAYLAEGIKSIPHKSRNKATGRGYSEDLKNKILSLYTNEYYGWNFHHFNDALEEHHNIIVSDSFIYELLTSNGIESPYKYKQRKKSHPPRARKEFAGELIQFDASEHPWFYLDEKYYFLHGGIDDATGKVTGCFFAEQETIYGYQMVLSQTLKDYGIPVCLYTDFRTIFQSPKRELTIEEEIKGKQINNTRFTNMLEHIGIDIKSTSEPRAKGRIERLWRTFQDRLYKELKKENIDSIEKANEYLVNVFLPKYNARFALPIDDNKNYFICLDETFDFNRELAVWKEYSIHHNCYLRFDNQYHVILNDDESHAYIKSKDKVRVFTFLDGSINVLYNNQFYKTKQVKSLSKEEFVNKLSATTKKEADRSLIGKNNSQNSPWRNGLPPIPNKETLTWAYFNAS